uniref:Serine/threonine-protein kinase ATR n=1 Tax=Caenorhabditis tropicalis TaxID=1561998 RepID=A0A1I7UFB6_9PELO
MIVEYLNDLVDGMELKSVESISQTFFHIIKCLRNVTIKASRPSRSPLMNVLVEQLFKSLQLKFDRLKTIGSITTVSCFYTQIYSNLLPQLDHLHDHWTRENGPRSEMCQLDALMKMEANRDPSGELVRTAFRSIDEEQVIKMLGELGIHSTSDHTFQDYQILAENWNRIQHSGNFDFGEF